MQAWRDGGWDRLSPLERAALPARLMASLRLLDSLDLGGRDDD